MLRYYKETSGEPGDIELYVFDQLDDQKLPMLEDWKRYFSDLHFNESFIKNFNLEEIDYDEFYKLYLQKAVNLLCGYGQLDKEEFAEWFICPSCRRNRTTGELIFGNPLVTEMPYNYLDENREFHTYKLTVF